MVQFTSEIHSAGNSVKIKSVNGSPEPKVKLTSKIGKCDLDCLILTNLQILLRHSVGNSVNGRRLNLYLASEQIDMQLSRSGSLGAE